jgi:plastocyanin
VTRIARWAVPIAALLAVAFAEQGAALAATTNVSMTNYVFTPKAASVTVGDNVVWKNNTTSTPHTTTSDTPLSLWDSATVSPGTTFSYTFTAAGTYPYHCNFHQSLGMVGSVAVAPTVSPASGPLGTTFTITWATVSAPSGFVYDVQYMVPGGTTWTTRSGLTISFVMKSLPTKGTWQFRARLRRTSNNAASNYSPIATASVT